MHHTQALRDVHDRTHGSVVALLEHCRELTDDQLHREVAGFGYPSVQRQFHHALGAERYWLGVLQGRIDVDDDEASYPTVDALLELREQVAGMTRLYLRSTSNESLNLARTVTTWRGDEITVVPAFVVLRTQTHHYHHQGQIAAMCRRLGRPVPAGLDFALD
jgi:uncharacterized damage-inducible protein DinB